MTVTVRPATFEDAQQLWEWANDPVTRQNALNSDDIPWESHLTWLQGVLANKEQALYVAEWPGAPMGSCRFDISSEGAVVTIALAPAHRGKNRSVPVLQGAIDRYWTERGPRPIVAYIRSHNIPSMRLFAACNFRPVESDVDSTQRFVLVPE